MIFGSAVTMNPSLVLRQRIVLMAGIEATVLAHECRRTAGDAPPVGRAPVLVSIPADTHRVRLLIDEHEVLYAVCRVARDVDDRHVPDELSARRGGEKRGEPLERVRSAERVVFRVGGEDFEPAVLDELARV